MVGFVVVVVIIWSAEKVEMNVAADLELDFGIVVVAAVVVEFHFEEVRKL